MKTRVLFFLLSFFIFYNQSLSNEEDEACFECHNDRGLHKESGRKKSVYVNPRIYNKSIHEENGCVSCHADIDPDDLPHDEDLEKVDCSGCHDEAVMKFNRSLHGKALRQGKRLAPRCSSCHGKHNILSHKNENSKTFVMNIPYLCGSCHKEGTEVSKLQNISRHNVVENYSQSIHGDGIYKRGLTVTAVCNSCHTSHDILPHENSKSSISRKNIPKTCMQCHSQIERVHQKVIRGELWEKNPNAIPICVDCHRPHEVRRVFYEQSYPNSFCMKCHSDKNISKNVNGEQISLFVDENDLTHSVHKDNSCIKCHANINTSLDTICKNSGKVDCSMCHTERTEQYKSSIHGVQYAASNPEAPYCTDCHGTHNMLSDKNVESKTFRMNIPKLCGDCHKEDHDSAERHDGVEHEIVSSYQMSIHGKGLEESGLIVSATCIDCHTSHNERPANDPLSSVNINNISETCAQCHFGILEKFKNSIHFPGNNDTDKKLPVCNDCHSAHSINRVREGGFRQTIIDQCGKCHEDVTETYFDTFHGKVSNLGSDKTAKCYDCHGAHNILPTYDQNSTLSRKNIIETCKSCHPNSNRKFVGYLTHATHHDRDKYPLLYYTFWGMTTLLICTFTFFGVHTLMWLPRALIEKSRHRRRKREAKESSKESSEISKNDDGDNDINNNLTNKDT